MIFFDFEVFKHDWLVVAINPAIGKEYIIHNNRDELIRLYNEYRGDIWVAYNGRNYDQYILKGILLDFNPKDINDWIIVKGRKGWEYSSLFNKIQLNLYDCMPNIPVSLKVLEGFMGNNIHETSVPFNINRPLTPRELEETIKYCKADVINMIEVFMKRKSEFDAQIGLLTTFNLPISCLGKTQAQLAAVILDAKKQIYKDDWAIRLPKNAQLGKYEYVGDWFLDPMNHNPEASFTTTIGGLEHTIAWGGIHAGISKKVITCDEDELMFDADVGQLYPNIMRHYGLLSRSSRKPEMLDYILDESMRLKREKKKKEREPFKRMCNICYGAEGDPCNPLYDPLHRTLVCVFGQIFLIDLIDKIEDIITLINSNTDGIFFKVKKKDEKELRRRVNEWQERTKLIMEYDEYVKFISKDVNNYLAIQADGSLHCKGAYVKDVSDLDYDLVIVNEALRNYMVFGTPVETTIRSCTDLRKFQKIVKLSSKYKWVEHEHGYNVSYTKRGRKVETYDYTTKYDNKAYRVFASTDVNDGKLLKCDGVRNPAKFGNTPEHCFILNNDLTNEKICDKLDLQWYIDLAKERLRDFGYDIT